MAEKRMFTQKIIDSDAFLDMPLTTQALYFHLNMRADDDGFINNPKRIQRSIGASDDDLKLLIAKRFVICFENGVIVIKHWRMHNTLRKDRYNPTQYQEQLAMLEIKDNKAYTEKDIPNQVATKWQPNGNQLETQYSIVESSIVESSVVESSVVENSTHSAEIKSIISDVEITENEYNALIRKYGKSFVDTRIERSKKYPGSSNYQTVKKWCEEDYKKNKASVDKYNSFPQNQYDFEALEKEFVSNQPNDPEFERRMDELQSRLKEKYRKDK